MKSPIRMLQRAIVLDFLNRVIIVKKKQAAYADKHPRLNAASGDEIRCCIVCIEMLIREIGKYF